ncbi:MAG: taurine dioxygenase [Acidimicrobiia bacterium]|nr:taurine dioxygenase [Acidimicrobiia bacterium]MYG59649.1 taurine dioxygenase [Acidimicrobiia bacterium]MYJ31064.1 taurine dioxygenase [Acidimicrobiia bacterium]
MKVTPVAGSLGAELSGIDLVSMDDGAKKSLREAIVEHEVVFIRGAFLNEEQHLELGRVLGEPNIFPLFALLGATEPTMTVIEDGPDSPPEADYWHTDVTWIAEPPDFALLQANVVPERGGDTLWASMTAAFEALSEPMKDFCRGLTVRHSNDSFIAGMERKSPGMVAEHDLGRRLRDAYPPVDHPLIRTHPESGCEVLFLGGRFMQRVNELTEPESAALLGLLGRHVEDARFHCRWRWQPGDLAIWDERSTNHRSAADHFPQHRQIRRCEVSGARPTRH